MTRLQARGQEQPPANLTSIKVSSNTAVLASADFDHASPTNVLDALADLRADRCLAPVILGDMVNGICPPLSAVRGLFAELRAARTPAFVTRLKGAWQRQVT
jgi:hypothetical protein